MNQKQEKNKKNNNYNKNNQKNNHHIIGKLLSWSFLALLCLSPFFRGLFFDQEMLIFQIMLGVVFGIAVWYNYKNQNNGSFLAGPLDYMVLAFAVTYLISAIDPAHARDAVGELLRVTTYFFVYWLAAYQINRQEVDRALAVLLLSGLGVSLAGLGTALGTLDLHGAWQANRIYSTLQYPNTLAAYLMAMNIIGLYLWARWDKFYLKAPLAAINMIYLLTILGTNSRGAWLLYPVCWLLFWLGMPGGYRWEILANTVASGAVAMFISTKVIPAAVAGEGLVGWQWLGMGVVAMVALQLILSSLVMLAKKYLANVNQQLIAYSAMAVLALALAGGLVFWQGAEDKEAVLATVLPDTVVKRLQTIDLEQHSATERLYFNEDALAIVKDNPILGTGGGGWAAVYPGYQQHLYFTTETHNHFFQVWVETGTLGFAIFLAVWLAVLWLTISTYRATVQQDTKAVSWALLMGGVTLGMHSAIDFNLSLSAIAFLLWFFWGLSRNVNRAQDDVGSEIFAKYQLTGVKGKWLGIALSCLVVIASVSFITAGKWEEKAMQAYEQGDIGAIEKNLKKAMAFDPFSASYHSILAQVYHYYGSSTGSGEHLRQAIVYGEQAISREPYTAQLRLTQTNMLFSVGHMEQAIKQGEKAVTLAPLHIESYESLANIYWAVSEYYYQQEQQDQAAEYLQALSQIPSDMTTKWESLAEERRQAWRRGKKLDQLTPTLQLSLGKGAVVMGDYTKAAEYLTAAKAHANLADESVIWLALLTMKTEQMKEHEEYMHSVKKMEETTQQKFAAWQQLL